MDKLYVDKQKDWICIQLQHGKPWFRRDTLSYNRKSSIEILLKESGMDWKRAKKYGWVCKKVSVEITVLN